MEHSGDGLVELVELVNLLAGRDVPQHSIGKDQLIRRAECGTIFSVLVVDARHQRQDFLARVDIVDGGSLQG